MTHKQPNVIRRKHIFCCDRCGQPIAEDKDEEVARDTAERMAKFYGWRMTGDSLVCVECQHEWGPE